MAALGTWGLVKNVHKNGIEIKIRRGFLIPILALTAALFVSVIQAHKDLRFSYPVYLFSTLIVLLYAIQGRRGNQTKIPAQHRAQRGLQAAALLVFTLAGVFLFEASGFHLEKSESGIEMARFLATRQDRDGIAIEEIWRAGGRLYLGGKHPLINIDSALMGDQAALTLCISRESISWIGIRDDSIRKYGRMALLNINGYKEVKFSRHSRRENYRLFQRGN